MPFLARPDGARIYWEEAGDGPGVLLCNTFNLAPLDPLVERLASSRRVIDYEPRGLGRSSDKGPYDLETGAADLEALLEETGPVEVALAIGDGTHRAIRVADGRPDLIDRVVFTSTAIGRESGDERAGFAASREVLFALMSVIRRDYRTGLRQMLTGSAHNEAEERERLEELVAVIPQDAAIGYLEAWIAAEGFDIARRLGDRLTVLAYPGNAWFPIEMYEGLRAHLTEACFEFVQDGPITRPDLAAEVLLKVSARATG
jgi:hypothetical protein